MKVQNKVVIVTGGGNGIGRQLVLALVRKGAKVAAVDINEKALQETKSLAGEFGEKISTHVLDITDQKAVEGLVDQVIKAHGSVDILINNAGIIQPFVRFKDLPLSKVNQVMDVNFNAVVFLTKTFLPYLLNRPEAHIVNISSMGGFLPVPGQTLYGASKAAVKLFTEGLHSELIGSNVHVTVVFPGAIGTNIAVNSGVMSLDQAAAQNTGKMKFIAPESAAQGIIKGIEENKYRVLIGTDAKLMDLLTRLNPKGAVKFIYNQMRSLLPS